ncbi:DNA-binding transcriptional repressor AcrR [Acinetobacter stercoris]|uniref:DNA-binding transcriptional repressor AcrR n=2 Tax=Acinetobacter stercoris TaxID=2126983 RepID=A0A2U3MUE8_9GAMM|nr:DNA-binding transcriptional repressor AcrR [Acinetobacter stercoris]
MPICMLTRQQQAAQNREDLLKAALIIFRHHGIRAPLQKIIDQAGVGRATFYRNFKDRKELVIALLEFGLERLEKNANYFIQFEDGLFQLIRNYVNNLPQLTALVDYWRVIDHHDPILIEIYTRRDAILQPLIDKAVQHKVCRADLTPKDYAMIVGILRSSFQGLTDDEQIKLANRAVDLLINGIKA